MMNKNILKNVYKVQYGFDIKVKILSKFKRHVLSHRSIQAHSEEEGEDHQEVGAQDGVLGLQVEEPGAHQENQTLRAGRREEEEGTDDPVLNLLNLSLSLCISLELPYVMS